MNNIKIGKFIAECRKEKCFTQSQLAEKLNITDRAVSKWETGRSMPDVSVMQELCSLLGISVNELLSGERINMEDYSRIAEENLIELQKEKENSDKMLLFAEIIIGSIITISFFIVIFMAALVVENIVWRIITIIAGALIFIAGISICILIEQRAGYYKCNNCGHKYIPSYKQVFFSMHRCRTRYMECPECHKRSWSKKVITKD